MTPLIFLLSIWTSPGALQVANKDQMKDQNTAFFKMTIFVYEGLRDGSNESHQVPPELVKSALDQVGKIMDYQGFRLVDRIAWMVRTQQDMDRFLDIPEKWWTLAEDTNISFKLVFNFEDRFLSLTDFRFMINQIPKLHTSVGLAHGEAAVLGYSKIDATRNDLFFIVTLDVKDTPFPGQSDRAIFTVTGMPHKDH